MKFRPGTRAIVLVTWAVLLASTGAKSQTTSAAYDPGSVLSKVSGTTSFRIMNGLEPLEPPAETAPAGLWMVTSGPRSRAANRLSSGTFAMSSSLDPPAGSTIPDAGNQESFPARAFKRGLEDQKQIWTAPFQRANLKWDALFLAGTGTLIAFDEQILHALPNSPVSTSSNVSNAILAGTGVTLGGIYFISGLHGGNQHAKETGVLAIETLANTFLVYAPLQLIAGRQRPNEGNGEGSFFRNHSVNTSFPGGHSMFEFAMATTIAHEYPRWWVQLLAYGAAGAVTGARMTAKMHFPSDLLVGGALGYLIGTHVFHAHCNPVLGGDCHSSDKDGP